MKHFTIMFLGALLVFAGLTQARAQTTVALLPLEGSPTTEITTAIRNGLTRNGAVSLIAENALEEILKLQEQAQLTGSDYHDIAELKTARYIVKGEVTESYIILRAIDVNTGTEIHNSRKSRSGSLAAMAAYMATQARNAIILHAAEEGIEAPDESKPYLAFARSLVQALSGSEEALYNHLAIYSRGKFVHPDKSDRNQKARAERFISILRPNLSRARLSFAGLENVSGNMVLYVIADKAGKKTRHALGIVELEDGSLATVDELYKLNP